MPISFNASIKAVAAGSNNDRDAGCRWISTLTAPTEPDTGKSGPWVRWKPALIQSTCIHPAARSGECKSQLKSAGSPSPCGKPVSNFAPEKGSSLAVKDASWPRSMSRLGVLNLASSSWACDALLMAAESWSFDRWSMIDWKRCAIKSPTISPHMARAKIISAAMKDHVSCHVLPCENLYSRPASNISVNTSMIADQTAPRNQNRWPLSSWSSVSFFFGTMGRRWGVEDH